MQSFLPFLFRFFKEKFDMIFETHAHYDDEKFDEDRAELLSSMQENGIGRIINVSANLESLENTRKLMEAYPFIYGAFGLHPDEVGDLNEDVMARMREPAAWKRRSRSVRLALTITGTRRITRSRNTGSAVRLRLLGKKNFR